MNGKSLEMLLPYSNRNSSRFGSLKKVYKKVTIASLSIVFSVILVCPQYSKTHRISSESSVFLRKTGDGYKSALVQINYLVSVDANYFFPHKEDSS